VYIPREKFIACRENKITPSSSCKDTGDHASLGANQEQAHKAQAFSYDTGLSRGFLHSGIHLPTSTRPMKG
jgi:hypothetical protein